MSSTYAYRVRDKKGKLVEGELVADNRDLVLSKLREQGFIPLEVNEQGKGLQREFRLRPGRVKLKDLAVFSRQFATMVNSGLPLLRALAVLEDQTEDAVLKKVLGEVRLEVERGSALSTALGQHEKTFPRLYIAMVRAGETGGVLDQVLVRLADSLEKEVALRQKIKSAMTYPAVVLGLVIVILTAMLVFVVPTFEKLYGDLGGTLPAPTKLLIGLSNFVKGNILFIIVGVIGLIFGFKRWKQTDRGRRVVDRLKLKAPVFGPLFHKTALSRFARTLSVLNKSGVPILQSLDIVQETVDNTLISDAVKDVQDSVKEGESLAKPLSRHEIFPSMVVQMMSIGEETGSLDEMLEKIADFYDQEVEAAVDALTSLIEPVMVAFVGGAVGAMVIALYLPLFKISELIR